MPAINVLVKEPGSTTYSPIMVGANSTYSDVLDLLDYSPSNIDTYINGDLWEDFDSVANDGDKIVIELKKMKSGA